MRIVLWILEDLVCCCTVCLLALRCAPAVVALTSRGAVVPSHVGFSCSQQEQQMQFARSVDVANFAIPRIPS
jgi:hypothetical protein